jgi:23S rRNA (cytosine1962-C5)-methyltransferase
MNSYPRLVLKKGRDRAVRNRHPWVFSGAVESKPQAALGAIVQVHASDGQLLGYGHYAPNATLICRMFHFGQEGINVDAGFWVGKLAAAKDYRHQVMGTEITAGLTDGYRLVHAEGDGLPGVVIDLYGDAASVQLRSAGAQSLQILICGFLEDECGARHIYVSTDKKEGKEDLSGNWIKGEPQARTFLENGLKFWVDIAQGQKTGFFLDQRENRVWVGKHAGGAKILNAFSYSGAFSSYALQGGAKHVTSVDISASATEYATQNVALNIPDSADRHLALKADCFQYLKDMPDGAFDQIILDPPAFTKHASTVDKAARGYKEINLKAIQKIAPGGLVYTFSCSQHISPDLFRKIVFGAAADAGRDVRIVRLLSQSPDHPINIYHPEGEYLKGLMLQVV